MRPSGTREPSYVTIRDTGLMLPSELVDTIIDCLCDSKPEPSTIRDLDENKIAGSALSVRDLATCSLISRDWRLRSQHHIFRSLRLSSNPGPLKDFPFSTVGHHVCDLHIGGYSINNKWLTEAFEHLDKFPSLQSLCIDTTPVEIPDASSIASSFGRLTSLMLKNCAIQSINQLYTIISLCSDLESLSISHVTTLVSSIRSVAQPTSRSKLRFLELSPCSIRKPTLRWLLTWKKIPPIARLRLAGIRRYEFQAIEDLLRGLGPALKHLELDLAHTDLPHQNADISFVVDLRAHTKLRSIDFGALMFNMSHRYHRPATVSHVPGLLAHITSSHLESIGFEPHANSPNEVESLNWDALGSIFERPNFYHMREIHLSAVEDWQREGVQHLIEQSLPIWSFRGSIVFTASRCGELDNGS